ncbi:HD family phosphohydrolase [Cylindrospermum sp. FACHB-282]|uniref:HD family phosphohydrolase n=1 Tax=Cylindrospermum sp. FACHB-282 TaxID=2692794 RepID=UPI00168584F0|nr:HD family phosphohydrolase [Cylindrospermum sp. FACHB-282]MBD2385777.1 HD family phosphohydrolase [Cylindrospermum sp. FACHB-282]
MKTQQLLQSLTQQLRQLRRWYKVLWRKGKLLGNSTSSKSSRRKNPLAVLKNILLYLSTNSHTGGQRKPKQPSRSANPNSGINAIVFGWIHEQRSSVILVFAVVSLTGVIGHKSYNQPQLKVGTFAPQTVIAPYTASIEDHKETTTQRKAVSQSSIPVLMVDGEINEQISQKLQRLLDDGNEIRAAAGPFPFFDTLALSISSQRYLRPCSHSEWQEMQVALENSRKQKLGFSLPKLKNQESQENFSQSARTMPRYANSTQNNPLTQIVAELEAYRNTTSEQSLSSVIAQISQARKRYSQAIAKLIQLDTVSPETVYESTVFLDLSDEDWGKTKTGIHQSLERILTQGISYGLPPNILHDAVSLQVQMLVPSDAEPLAVKLLLAVLKPNLKQDEEQTKQRAQQAAAGVPAVIIKVRQGEIIVKKGEKITFWNFAVLEHYHLIRREVNWLGLLGLAALITSAIGIFVWVERRINCHWRQRDRLLVLLLTVSTPGLLAMGVPYTTWSALGLLLGSFYGPTLSLTVVMLLLLILPFSLEIGKIWLLAGAAGGILSSCVAQRLRSREELALLGVAIALTQGGIYLLLKMLIGEAFGSAWYLVLQEAVFFALSGLAWSIVALGLSPYLEKLFDLVTPIRLAELANPNRALLKRLATETPGTFQHTLFVATLAEAAAKQLGCNVELVRAGTLYHDIGKMHDPQGFIENQMGGPNKHETEINDPWKSAAIIKKHVTEGLVMARKHSLPKAIQAFIPEHQGTMAIAYFYHQAQQMAKEDPSLKVDKADFSYDGPIPQSRETGIVMLADSCEAALRSLKDASSEQALTMLNNILRARWQDGQLLDSGLTRDEMSKIAQIFVDVWQQFHHKRIAYPKLTASK